MTTIEEVTARLATAQERLDALEKSLDDLEGVERVKEHLKRENLTSAALKTAPTLQYNSKLDAEQLRRFVRDNIPEADRPSKKKFNFQHAPGEVSEELTGFGHNGVSAFGMKTPIPVIVAGAIAELRPPCLWLGGGAESVKLRISVQDLVKALGARVADGITSLRVD
ncbi:hypothetical protein PInf_018709 [Phytophthora infestans]|nr:hypothetical protein PInf_018709 [Phytophthora infestans]